MSKKEHYGFNDLVDTLTEDMTPVKALKVKRMLADIYNHRLPIGVAYAVLAIGLIMGMCAGVIWIGEFIKPPAEPIDWPQFGFLFMGLAVGVALGTMLALDDIIGRVRRRAVKIVEDVIEGDKS